MPRSWDVPTYADATGADAGARVRCPCCRRWTRADTLRDMRAVPGWAWDYACDGCVTLAARGGHLDPADTLRRQGAPEAVVAKVTGRGR